MRTRTVLITGATGGIGQAISRKMAAQGYQLQLHYHQNRTVAIQLKQELENAYNHSVALIQADLSQPQGVEKLLSCLPTSPDILIFNAGRSVYGLFTELSPAQYEEMIQLHLTSTFRLAQALVPALISRKWGRIIFITSIWGDTGASCETIYSLVKGGLTSLCKALAKELAPSGITVNAVSPGAVDTAMLSFFTAEEIEALQDEIPLGRAGTPDEVAFSVQYLASEECSYTTGQVLRVNGGWYT